MTSGSVSVRSASEVRVCTHPAAEPLPEPRGGLFGAPAHRHVITRAPDLTDRRTQGLAAPRAVASRCMAVRSPTWLADAHKVRQRPERGCGAGAVGVCAHAPAAALPPSRAGTHDGAGAGAGGVGPTNGQLHMGRAVPSQVALRTTGAGLEGLGGLGFGGLTGLIRRTLQVLSTQQARICYAIYGSFGGGWGMCTSVRTGDRCWRHNADPALLVCGNKRWREFWAVPPQQVALRTQEGVWNLGDLGVQLSGVQGGPAGRCASPYAASGKPG